MNERAWFLQYDIPEVRNLAGRVVPVHANPSDDLWRAGCVRLTDSCWLVLDSRLNRTNLVQDSMRRAGCVLFTLPFDVSAGASIRAAAVACIRREVEARLESARQTREDAETRLDDESESDYRKRRARLLSAARGLEKRVRDTLRHIGAAAEGFGISAEEVGATSAVASVEYLAAQMRERASAFADAHGLLVRRGGDGAALARGMRNGDTPPEIVSDWLMDNDDWDAGERLGTAFRPSF